MRKTKIVCTIGPATNSEEMINSLIKAGMNVARLNFSHGSKQEHKKVIKIIRKIADDLHKPVAILQDLQGPKIRLGKIRNGSLLLKSGSKIKITIENIEGNEQIISTSYKNLITDIRKNNHILLNDGLVKLKVVNVWEKYIECKIVEGGIISDHNGINLPGVEIRQPSLTEKDKQDLALGIAEGVDLVAMSFVRSAEDIVRIKKIIAEHNKQIKIMAKLEKSAAINNLQSIMEVADGVLIARGDLGVEMPMEKVPFLQKKIIRLALPIGKPVITATQMLESLRNYPRPHRA